LPVGLALIEQSVCFYVGRILSTALVRASEPVFLETFFQLPFGATPVSNLVNEREALLECAYAICEIDRVSHERLPLR
jgi:hypothetical protein